MTHSPSPIAAALFDLDGTLLDTAPDLVGALNHVRNSEGLPDVPVSDYRRYVSRGAIGLITKGMPGGDEDLIEERRLKFLAHYEKNSLDRTRPFEGVEDVLRKLEGRGIPWAIVTNKPEFLTLPILDHLGWARRPSCVICGDTLAERKPHPMPVLVACELSGAKPAQTIMVGDDPRDLESAIAAGSVPVLAGYGYGAREVLAAGGLQGPVISSPGELLGLFAPSN